MTYPRTHANNQPCGYRPSRGAKMSAAIVLLTSIWTYNCSARVVDNSIPCDYIVPPEFSVGSTTGTWDPSQTAVGDIIKVIIVSNAIAARIICNGSTVPGETESSTRGLTAAGESSPDIGLSGYFRRNPAFGFRVYARYTQNNYWSLQSSGGSLIGHGGANIDGREYTGTGKGEIARIEIYKRLESAENLNIPAGFIHYYELVDQGRLAYDGVTLPAIQLTAISKTTCSVDNPDIVVNGLNGSLSAPDPIIIEKRFSIQMHCDGPAGAEASSVRAFMTDGINPSNSSSQLSMSPSSTAKGLAAEIYRADGTQVYFDATRFGEWVDPQELGVGDYELPFNVKIVKVPGEELSEGRFEFQAAYNLTYF